MHQQTLDNFRETLARQQQAVRQAEDPAAASRLQLQQAGYLDADGNVAEPFREGLPVKPRRSKQQRATSKRMKKVAKASGKATSFSSVPLRP